VDERSGQGDSLLFVRVRSGVEAVRLGGSVRPAWRAFPSPAGRSLFPSAWG
jgi:hypothetical protein